MKVKVGLPIFLLLIGFFFFMLSMSVYGIILAFKASVLIGFLALLIEPTPFIFGIVMFLTGQNIAQAIADLLNK
jgi:hypothetical protein